MNDMTFILQVQELHARFSSESPQNQRAKSQSFRFYQPSPKKRGGWSKMVEMFRMTCRAKSAQVLSDEGKMTDQVRGKTPWSLLPRAMKAASDLKNST